MKNWKTTAAGALTLLVIAANTFGYIDGPTMEKAIGLLAGVGLWYAKDHNVTGGKTKQ